MLDIATVVNKMWQGSEMWHNVPGRQVCVCVSEEQWWGRQLHTANGRSTFLSSIHKSQHEVTPVRQQESYYIYGRNMYQSSCAQTMCDFI